MPPRLSRAGSMAKGGWGHDACFKWWGSSVPRYRIDRSDGRCCRVDAHGVGRCGRRGFGARCADRGDGDGRPGSGHGLVDGAVGRRRLPAHRRTSSRPTSGAPPGSRSRRPPPPRPSPGSPTAPRTRSRWRPPTTSAPAAVRSPTQPRRRRCPARPRRTRRRGLARPRARGRPARTGGRRSPATWSPPYIRRRAAPSMFGSTATTQAITGLTNGTSVPIKVAAMNASARPGRRPSPTRTPATTVPTRRPSARRGRRRPGAVSGPPRLRRRVAHHGLRGHAVHRGRGADAGPVQRRPRPRRPSPGWRTATYTFTVAAINAVGTGRRRRPRTPSPPRGAGRPDHRVRDGRERQGDRLLDGTGVDGGSPITGYVVTPYIGAFTQPVAARSTRPPPRRPHRV